uniref:CCHC-type domain-containing protein n=1 Tax=Caenorhabditis japonica TaxID=281687 RepID=A0A8R1DRY1_CAEJA
MERQQLRQCLQHVDESVDDFSTRVRKLAQSAHAGKSRDFVQEKAKESFIDGLLFNLKFHVKGESPSSFQEAQNSAMKFEMLLAEAARANTILPQGLAVMPAPAPTHQPKKAKGECFYCGIPGHFANECRRRVKDRANGIFRRENKTGFNPRSQTGFNPRSQTRSFPQNNPITNHQIFANQPTVQTIQSAVPALHAQMDALKAELEVRQNQINALIRRNDELAGSAPVTQSSNARVSCFRWSQTCLLTFLTLGSLLTPAFAVDPLVCMPHSPQKYIRLPAPQDCSKASSPEPHPVVYKELTIYRPNTIAYESNGTLCKIVKRVTKYSVNMFGVRSEESTVNQLTVSSEELPEYEEVFTL